MPLINGGKLDLRRGEIFALLGSNGAGKMKDLRAIAEVRQETAATAATQDPHVP